MAVTITKIKGPSVVDGVGLKYVFSLALDNSFAAGGENLDLTDYLSTIITASVDGMDAVADATRRFDIIPPGVTTALTSTNVKLVAHHSSGADAVDNHADSEDLSAIGALIITCVGKGTSTI